MGLDIRRVIHLRMRRYQSLPMRDLYRSLVKEVSMRKLCLIILAFGLFATNYFTFASSMMVRGHGRTYATIQGGVLLSGCDGSSSVTCEYELML